MSNEDKAPDELVEKAPPLADAVGENENCPFCGAVPKTTNHAGGTILIVYHENNCFLNDLSPQIITERGRDPWNTRTDLAAPEQPKTEADESNVLAALRRIHEMAAEDLRVERVFVCHSFMRQIEADAHAALERNSDDQ